VENVSIVRGLLEDLVICHDGADDLVASAKSPLAQYNMFSS
jgi:hypothetical protein